MKALNEMKPRFQAVRRTRHCPDSGCCICRATTPTVDELTDIKTAVSEAVTNCIIHAYRDTIGTIYITVRIFESGNVTVRIRDRGCGMEDVQKAMEPLFTTGGAERAGLGFAVMQSFCNRVSVSSTPGKGTTVTLQKRVSRRLPGGKHG